MRHGEFDKARFDRRNPYLSKIHLEMDTCRLPLYADMLGVRGASDR